MSEAEVLPETRTSGPKRIAAFAVIAYLAFNLLLPLIRVPVRGVPLWERAVLVLGSTAVFMLLQLWLARALVRLKPRVVTCVFVMAVSVIVWFLVARFVYPHRGWTLAVNRQIFSLRGLGMGLSITLACTFLGILASRIVREANILLPVALAALVIDYIGVLTPVGFTQNVVAKNPGLVQAVSVPVPTMGGVQPIAFIGPGDVLFMAFFFAVVSRLNLNVRGTFWLMYALLTLALIFVILPGGFNVPALVPMGVAVLLANGRAFRLQRSEAFAVLYAGVIVVAAVVGFYSYTHSRYFGGTHDNRHAPRTFPAPAPGRPAGNR